MQLIVNFNNMKTFKITEEVLQGIISYLAQRPYAEVAQGIQALGQLEEIVENKSAEEKTKNN